MKKKRKIILIVIIALAVICTLAIAWGAFWLLIGVPTRYKATEDYGKHQEFFDEGELLLFPEKLENTQNSQFYFLHRDTLFNPTVQVYLKCNYDKATYEKECERIKNVSVTWREETQSTSYDGDHFLLPAYVAIYETYEYEYALLEEETNTIVYVYMRFLGREEVQFPKEYLPKNYKNGKIDISEEKNIYGLSL